MLVKQRSKNNRKKGISMKRKGLAVGIILLFMGLAVVPSINATRATLNDETSPRRILNTTEEPGTLSGHVTDAAMNPIEGARVRVSFHGTYQENYSDVTGYYHITDIPLCNCTKNSTCSKQGYHSVWVNLSIWEDTTYDFVLPLKGNWFYVGGSGPNNFTKIQDAIDNTTDGDTVYVFPGAYKEHIEINNSIQIQGADILITIIDGQNTSHDIITCIGTDVIISGFTIFNCSMSHSCVLMNHTANCTLYGNIIHTGGFGVIVQNAQNISIINNTFLQIPTTINGYIAIALNNCIFCTLSQNKISSWDGGILIKGTHFLITQNTIANTHRGITDMMDSLPFANKYFIIDENHLNNNTVAIFLAGSRDYSITRNEITNSTTVGLYMVEEVFAGDNPENITIKDNLIAYSVQGMVVENSINMSIEANHFQHNTLGLSFLYSSFTSVKKNTFQDNTKTVVYQWAFFPFSRFKSKVPQFDMNFWDQPQQSPYPVVGRWGLHKPWFFFSPINLFPWVTFDWHPAQEPYAIEGTGKIHDTLL
jgi:parallel beta-helix repeat protein